MAVLKTSKSTPRPILRRTTRHVPLYPLLLSRLHLYTPTATPAMRPIRVRRGIPTLAAAQLALPPLPDSIPLPVLPGAGLAGTTGRPVGVELGVLV